MFAHVQNEIGMGTMSEYDTLMFTYTTPPLKVVFLKDRVLCSNPGRVGTLCRPNCASSPMLGSKACATVPGLTLSLDVCQS